MAGRRELLIDAFNVIFAHPQLGPLVRRDQEAAREQFVALVNQKRPADATRVYVVFDAHRAKAHNTETGRQDTYRGAVHMVFARETADAWIQRRIREASDPGMITVITSDNAIIATVRAYGAHLLRVRDFLQLSSRRKASGPAQRPGPADDKPERLSRRELEEWERLFEKPADEDLK